MTESTTTPQRLIELGVGTLELWPVSATKELYTNQKGHRVVLDALRSGPYDTSPRNRRSDVCCLAVNKVTPRRESDLPGRQKGDPKPAPHRHAIVAILQVNRNDLADGTFL